jgi:AcrR family transcriptional regulator
MKKQTRVSKKQTRIRRAAPDMRGQALAAARKIIVDRKNTMLTMRAVAEEAGVTHPNLSHHFGSLAGLHAALAVELIRELLNGLREMGVSIDKDDDYEALVDRVFELFHKNGLARVLAWLARSGDSDLLKPAYELVTQFISEIAAGRSAGEGARVSRDALILVFAAFAESLAGPLLGSILELSAAQRKAVIVQALIGANKA